MRQFDRFPVPACRHLQYVGRDCNVYRARALAAKYRECPGKQDGDFLGRHRGGRKCGQWSGHSGQAGYLMQSTPTLAQCMACRIGGQHQHGNAICVGLAHGGCRVGNARSRDQQRNTGFARRARVAIRHETSALLVARLHVLNRTSIQSPAEFQRVHSRNAEDSIHSIGFEQFDTGFAHIHFDAALRVHWLILCNNAAWQWSGRRMLFR